MLLLFPGLLAIGSKSCNKDDKTPEKLLTQQTWKADEIRIQLSNNRTSFYKRGEVGNTYDSDSLKFNPNNTGIYYYEGESFPITWKFTNAEKSKMYITIDQPPVPHTVYLENIQLTKTSFKYVQYFNGALSYLASGTRVPN